MSKQAITEEMKVHEEWFNEAREMTMDKLPEFLRHLMEDYGHDYGTICHALTAGAIATAWAMDRAPQGGITGFQAGFIMWGFIRHWSYESNKCGMKIVDYDNMLYPQYEHKFEKTISESVWKILQDEAKKKLDKVDKYTHEAVVQHWRSIVDGKVPFGYKVVNE